MTPRDIVHQQIRHHETGEVPFTLEFEEEVGHRLDQYYSDTTWREYLTRYIIKAERIVLPYSMEPQARTTDVFGAVWKTDAEAPVLLEPALTKPSFEGYTFPTADELIDPTTKKKIKQTIEHAHGLSSPPFVIVNTGICLWQSWYIRGFENTLMDCVAEEDFYSELLNKLTELTLDIIERCKDIPCDALMVSDDWGDQRGTLIGPQRWRTFFKQQYARIFEAIHRQGKVTMLHCCGSVADIMDDIVEIGLDVLESVQPEAAGMNPYELKKRWGDTITFWGGLGTQRTIPFSSPTEIRHEIRRLRKEMSRGGGYILAPAKPLRPETPIENAAAVVDEFLHPTD